MSGMINIIRNGMTSAKAVDGMTKALVNSSGKIHNAANGNILGSMFEGLGKVLGFSGKVIAESSTASKTLLSTEALLTNKFAALATIGVGAGVTAKAAADTLRHSRTDYLIQTRSGGYMTDKDTNATLRNITLGTTGIGVVAGLQGVSNLAGESLIAANASSPTGSLLKTVSGGANKVLGTITGLTGSLGDAIKPGLGKVTGAPLALMLGGLVAHWAVDQIYLKMPQGDSVFNSFGWGGSKSFLVTDRTDANFLQPLGRDGLMNRIEEDELDGIGRAAPTSSFWDGAIA